MAMASIKEVPVLPTTAKFVPSLLIVTKVSPESATA